MNSACGSSACLCQDSSQLVFVDSGEQLGRRFASRRIHPHVERARLLVGEPARRVVELHR
jgi:hypothetical protein